MVNRNLIRSLEDDDIQSAFETLFEGDVDELDPSIYSTTDESGEEADFDINKIVEGRIVRIEDDMVLVDVGFKSEGSIPLSEWDGLSEPPQVGDKVHVMIEDLEDEIATMKDARSAATNRAASMERNVAERLSAAAERLEALSREMSP